MTVAFTEDFANVGGAEIQVFKGGSGEPLVLLHGAGGNRGAVSFARSLAEHYTVYMPSHPGFDKSERPDWLETMHDLASFYTWFLEDQGLEGSRAIGFSMGGWLAAEVATVCRHAFRKLMLVGAAGVQPRQGEITDIFLITPAAVNQLMFHDPAQAPEYDQLYGGDPTPEERYFVERNREMAVRLCWKPYMFDPTLPPRLGRVRIPVRMVWGQQDRLIPVECGDLYRQAIPGSDLVAIESCGHSPQIEKPEEFVKLALDFLA